jgi:hypothetical protein
MLLIPFLTGCADIDTRVNINNDKSASVVSSLSYKGNLSDLTDETATKISTVYRKFLDKSYKVETAYGAQLSTIIATKSIKNIEHENLDLSSLGFKTKLPDGKFIDVKKNLLVTSYNVNAIYDYKSKEKEIEKSYIKEQEKAEKFIKTINPEYFQKYAEVIPTENMSKENEQPPVETQPKTNNDENETKLTSTFGIKVPAFASYNNADKVEGFTYIWKIKNDGITEIKFQYVKYNGLAITLVIIIGILLLVLLAKRIIKHDSQKRSDNVNGIV